MPSAPTAPKFFLAHANSEKGRAREVRRAIAVLCRRKQIRSSWSDADAITTEQLYFDEASAAGTDDMLAEFVMAAKQAACCVLFVPAGGLRSNSFVRKELLAFLTGITHATREMPDPAALTPQQVDHALGRLRDLLLVDPHDELRWFGSGIKGLGPIGERGCLARVFRAEQPRLRETASDVSRIARAALARLWKVSPESVASEEADDRARIARRWAAGLSVTTAAFAALGVGTILSRCDAAEQRDEARAEATRAEIGELLRTAQSVSSSDPEVGLIVAAEGARRSIGSDLDRDRARAVLLDALERTNGRGLGLIGGDVFAPVISSSGRWVVASTWGPSAPLPQHAHTILWDLDAKDPAGARKVIATRTPGRGTFSPDERWLLLETAAPPGQRGTEVTIIDLAEPSHQPGVAVIDDFMSALPGPAFAFLDDRHAVRLGSPPSLWDLQPSDKTSYRKLLGGPTGNQSLSLDRKWLATTPSTRGRAQLWDLSRPDPVAIDLGVVDAYARIVFSPQARWLGIGETIFDLRAADIAASKRVLAGYLGGRWSGLRFDDRDRFVELTPDEDPNRYTWDLAGKALDAPVVEPATSPSFPMLRSGDGRWEVWESPHDVKHGRTRVMLTDTRSNTPHELYGALQEQQWDGYLLWFSPDSSRLYALDQRETLDEWTLAGPRSPRVVASRALGVVGGETLLEPSPDKTWIVLHDQKQARARLSSVDGIARPIEIAVHGFGGCLTSFSSDGRWIVLAASVAGTLRRIDLRASAPGDAPFPIRGALPAQRPVRGEHGGQTRFQIHGLDPVRLFDQEVGASASDDGHPDLPLDDDVPHQTDVATSGDSGWVAVSHADGTVSLFLIWEGGALLNRRWKAAPGIISLAFSTDDGWLLARTKTGTIAWDLTDRGPLDDPERPTTRVPRQIDLRVKDWISATANLGGNAMVVVTSRGHAELWTWLADPVRVAFEGSFDTLGGIGVCPDHSCVAAATNRGLLFWEMSRPSEPRILGSGAVSNIVVSDDGTFVATQSLDNVRLLGAPPTVPQALRGRMSRIHRIARHGPWIVADDDEGTLLWDTGHLDSEHMPEAVWSEWHPVDFDDAKGMLVLRNQEGRSSSYPLTLDAAYALAMPVAGRNLTQAEWDRYAPSQAAYAATYPMLVPLEPHVASRADDNAPWSELRRLWPFSEPSL